MFDGVLGVISALEAIRRMNDEGFQNRRPIEIVVFIGEEGSAFRKVLLGSSVFIGESTWEEAYKLRDDKGVTLEEVLIEHGLLGASQFSVDDIDYFIELHVEQGPVLNKEKIPLGIVESVTGLTWIRAVVKGEENHAGTTPMHMRVDPLVASSEVVSFTNRKATEMAAINGTTVATVGKLVVHPGSPNIVPGEVELGIDIRDTDAERKKKITNEIVSVIKHLEEKFNVETEVEFLFDHPPSKLSDDVIQTIQQAAESIGIDYKVMNSGAGHDAQNLAHKVKTGMIFVPSINGISHSPLEWTEWCHVENGIQVLTETLKLLSST
jgi:N-carbamoyl-L-amino-acid hydrolase